MANYYDKLEKFAVQLLKNDGDIKERGIKRWHLGLDYVTAPSGIFPSGIFDYISTDEIQVAVSGVFASGIFDYIKIGPDFPASGHVLTTDASGWGTWQATAAAEAGVASGIFDADWDTRIQVEESTDEDIIRIGLGDATLSAAREVLTIQAIDANDVKVEPTTDDDVDLGSVSKEFRNLYIDGTANVDSLVVDTADINAGTWTGTIDGNWTAAGQTCTDLGTVTTANIDGGTLDGVQIGGTTATGELIVNDASDNADGLGSQGSSGEYLKSQGAGTNPTWDSPSGGTEFVTGDLLFSSVTTAHSGWTEVTATYNNKFIRISTGTPLGTGGADTHTHGAGSYIGPSHVHSVPHGGWGTGGGVGDIVTNVDAAFDAANSDKNSGSGGATSITGSSASGDNVPAYIQVKVFKKD